MTEVRWAKSQSKCGIPWKTIAERGDCCMWHQLFRDRGPVGRVTIESWCLGLCYILK